MDNLIAKIEGAAEGSRELDDEIATLIFTDKRRTCIKGLSDEAGGMWMFRYPNGSIGSSLRFTGSLDAALTLVPEDYAIDCLKEGEPGDWYVNLRPRHWIGEWRFSKARTAPLAICIAALKARAQQEMKS